MHMPVPLHIVLFVGQFESCSTSPVGTVHAVKNSSYVVRVSSACEQTHSCKVPDLSLRPSLPAKGI